MNGWISLHRKILENPILNRSRIYSPFEAWIWLLLRANHKDNKFMLGSELVKVKKGSMITSQKKLCNRFRWGSTKLRNFLKVLQKDKMILLKTDTQATYITICNYDTYQDKQISNKMQTNIKQNANKYQTKTNNKDNKDNKDNNVNNDNKKITINSFKDLLKDNVYLKKYGFDMIEEFVDYWIEPTINGKKYKFETEKTFDIKKRLNKWSKNDFTGYYKMHKEKLINQEKEEYYKKAEQEAYKDPEYQHKEINKITKNIFKKL